MTNFLSLIIALFALINPTSPSRTPDHAYQVSLVREGEPGQATNHGWDKIKAALSAKGIQYEEVSDPKAAHSGVLIAAGLWSDSASGSVPERIRALSIKMPSKPESLVIHKGEWQGKQALLLSGSDDRGLMYALLEVADRIGWAKDKALPLSEVRDTVESPDVADRDVVILTMQKHQYEDRLHDENYWAKYFDTLADDRFNSIEVKFAHEANGYNCPVYPYYMDVNGFPHVKVTGLSKEEQQRNLTDLHRLVRLAHERGIRVTFGIWCHYYRNTIPFNSTAKGWVPVDHSKPVADIRLGRQRPRHRELHGLAGDDFVGRVSEFDQNLVRAGYQSNKNNRFATGIDKVPRRVVDGNMDVADTWRHSKSALAKYRHDAKIFRPILNENAPQCKRFREWWIHNQSCRSFIFNGNQR